MNYRVILAFSLLLTLSPFTSAAKVYTWTDANGVTHYGEHPPKGVTAKKINARTGHSEPTPIANTPITNDQENTGQNSTEPEESRNLKDPERCDAARKNLDILKSNARIKEADKDGNLRFLTEEERQGKFSETQKAIEESCE